MAGAANQKEQETAARLCKVKAVEVHQFAVFNGKRGVIHVQQ